MFKPFKQHNVDVVEKIRNQGNKFRTVQKGLTCVEYHISDHVTISYLISNARIVLCVLLQAVVGETPDASFKRGHKLYQPRERRSPWIYLHTNLCAIYVCNQTELV